MLKVEVLASLLPARPLALDQIAQYQGRQNRASSASTCAAVDEDAFAFRCLGNRPLEPKA